MGHFVCDTCNRSYKYKRNLKRHIEETHVQPEHWNCIVPSCDVTFRRRSYLFSHLHRVHGMPKCEARHKALMAERGDANQDTYYEDFSEDESIFDLIVDEENASSGSDQVSGYSSDIGDPDKGASCFSYSDISNVSVTEPGRESEAAEDDYFDSNEGEAELDQSDVSIPEDADGADAAELDQSDVSIPEDADGADAAEIHADVGEEESHHGEDVIVVSDNDEVEIRDETIRTTTQYFCLRLERSYVYRGNELIHSEDIMYTDTWLSNH